MTEHQYLLSALCTDACELLGIEPPQVEPNQDGTLAWTIAAGEITVSVLHSPRTPPERALVIAPLGEVASHGAQATWSALLETNAQLGGLLGPIFGREPGEGHAMLGWSIELASVHAAQLVEHIQLAVDIARVWRESGSVPDSQIDALARLHGEPQVQSDELGARQVQQLCEALFESAGMHDWPRPEMNEPVWEVEFEVQDWPVVMRHDRHHHSANLVIEVPLLEPEQDSELPLLEAFMETNIAGLCLRLPRFYVRDAQAGQLAIRVICPLAGVGPEELRDTVDETVQQALGWRQISMDIAAMAEI